MLLKAVLVFFQVTAAAVVVKLLFISRAKRNKKKTVKEHGVFNG